MSPRVNASVTRNDLLTVHEDTTRFSFFDDANKTPGIIGSGYFLLSFTADRGGLSFPLAPLGRLLMHVVIIRVFNNHVFNN